MRMSMAQEAAEASAAEGAEKMDVDEQKGDEDYSEAMNDPAFLQVTRYFKKNAFLHEFLQYYMWKKCLLFKLNFGLFALNKKPKKKHTGNTYLLSLCCHLT